MQDKKCEMGLLSIVLGPSKPHTLVPIKMSVSSLTTLHTLRQTLSFSSISKEQPLFLSVTKLNPVFQPILTVTFHFLLVLHNKLLQKLRFGDCHEILRCGIFSMA